MFTQKKAMGFTLKFECIESYLNENFVTELLRRRLGLIYKEKGGGGGISRSKSATQEEASRQLVGKQASKGQKKQVPHYGRVSNGTEERQETERHSLALSC